MTTCVEVKNGEGLKVGWDTARRGKRGNVLSSGKCFFGKCLHGKCFLGKYFYGKCLWMVLVIFWMDCMIRSYCWITPKSQQKCLTIFNVYFTLWRACIVMCSISKVPFNYGQHCGMVWRSFCLRMRIFLETIWTLDLLFLVTNGDEMIYQWKRKRAESSTIVRLVVSWGDDGGTPTKAW